MDDLKKLNQENKEYIIFYGNGKNYSRWINSLTNVFKKYSIVSDQFYFREMFSFENENRTYLTFPLNNMEFNLKNLSEYEYKLNELYGVILLSRYAKNDFQQYSLKGFDKNPNKIDITNIAGHSTIETTMKYYKGFNENEMIALKSGYYFMLFRKEEIPFFDELNKTDRVVRKDDKEYYLYDASTWEVAKKIDALMDDKGWLGYDIDEYSVDKNINV